MVNGKDNKKQNFISLSIIVIVFVVLITIVATNVTQTTSGGSTTFTELLVDTENSFNSEGGVLNVNNIFDEDDNTFGRVRT